MFAGVPDAAGAHRSQCDEGASWTQLTSSQEEVGLDYEVNGYSSLFADDVFRTYLVTGDLKHKLGLFRTTLEI